MYLPLFTLHTLLTKYGSSLSECMVYLVAIHFIYMYIFLYLFLKFHVCHCLGTGWFSTQHDSCWPLVPRVMNVFFYVSCTYYICGSCTGGHYHFSWDVIMVIVANLVGKWIMAYWKLILTSYSQTTNFSTKPSHVVILQL